MRVAFLLAASAVIASAMLSVALQRSPTPASGAMSDLFVAIDCDVAAPGIQSSCTVNKNDMPATYVDVVVGTTGAQDALVAVTFILIDPDKSRLLPLEATGLPLEDRNPDFIQSEWPAGWVCTSATADTGNGGPSPTSSSLGCLSSTNSGLTLTAGDVVRFGRTRYEIPVSAAPGAVSLTFAEGQATNETGSVFSCDNDYLLQWACTGATITIVDAPSVATATPTNTRTATATATATPQGTGATPTATPANTFFAIVDCLPSVPGVQVTCTYALDAPVIDVVVVLVNNTSQNSDLAAFEFRSRNPDRSRLVPPPGLDTSLNGNPDAAMVFEALAIPWICNLQPPSNDTGAMGSTGTESKLTCFAGQGVPIPAGAGIELGTVHYVVPPNAVPGSVQLSLAETIAGNEHGDELGVCSDRFPTNHPMPCLGATITLVEPPPTATPTATFTATPTPTPTPTSSAPSVNKIPEGNANNVDPLIPAANLWICVSGPCSGPGEGSLIVFEYARNVSTGDQNADTVQDGLGAYEFSVEYDNFVIQSVNPQDVVFAPLNSLSPYPGGADGVPDGEGAGRAPASCAFSLVFENIIHFGCTTSGPLPAGPTGDFDLARLELIPHPDLTNDIFPGNDNGVVTVLKDNGCELVDVFGHPVTGSIGGGLTPVCGDIAVTVRILEGDLDLDCSVDVEDQQLIAYRYNSFFGSSLYSQWYDLEPNLHDLDVDIKDIQKVFGRDGSTCQSPRQPQPPYPPPAPFGP